MNHISLKNLPRLDFDFRWLTRRPECFAKIAKRTVVAAKANLVSRFNVNPLAVADCAYRRDAHPKDSNSHLSFLSVGSGTPAKQKNRCPHQAAVIN
jgi:hypothetical protein